jgi:hypothetical protein
MWWGRSTFFYLWFGRFGTSRSHCSVAGRCSCFSSLKNIVGGEEFIYRQLFNSVANATPTEFPVFVLGVLLVSEVWVLVIRELVLIMFNCVDLVVFIKSVWGAGWLCW